MDHAVIHCARVAEVSTPKTGSIIRRCHECDAEVWVGPAVAQEVRRLLREDFEIFYKCAPLLYLRNGGMRPDWN